MPHNTKEVPIVADVGRSGDGYLTLRSQINAVLSGVGPCRAERISSVGLRVQGSSFLGPYWKQFDIFVFKKTHHFVI